MPGKINPVICEAVMMASMQVMGSDVTCALADASGNFELNVAMPVVAHNLLQSITILSNGSRVFADKCIAGIVPNREHLARVAGQNAILATALTPHIGYDKVAAAIETGSTPLTSREADVLRAAESGVSTEEMAIKLSLSATTVRNYLSYAISKVGGRNRIDGIRIARNAGWL